MIFLKEWFKRSEYPSNIIPVGAVPVVAVDYGVDGADHTVKGFYDPSTGELHIQEFWPGEPA